MQKLQRVLHSGSFQFFRRDDDFARRKPEFCVFAGGFRPFAFAARHELYAKTDRGNDVHFFRDADNLIHLIELLHDNNGALSQAASHQRKANVFFVLVAVADQKCFFAFEQRERD